MLTYLNRPGGWGRLNLIFFSLFLAIVLLMGGASRGDVLSQPFVRLAAILMIALCALQMDRDRWREAKAPILFLAAIAAVIGIQLVPLPHELWAALPGRAPYAEALEMARIAPAWRPISLTPDLTLNSLLAVLPPLAAVVAFVTLDRDDRQHLVAILLVGIALSAIIGVLQISSGSLYFYRITNEGSAVGIFANRNHQAVLLASALPLLAAWVNAPASSPAYQRVRSWCAACFAAAIFPILLVTGSRSGIVLGAVAAIAALVLIALERKRRGGTWRARLLRWSIPFLIAAAAIGVAILTSRDEALRRFADGQGLGSRYEFLPVFVQMIRDFLPIGSGFGSFDSVFRFYEPDAALQLSYLNHAHNDLFQIVIEGGVLSLGLLIPFLGWFVVRTGRLWFRERPSFSRLMGRAGSIVVILLLLMSVVDYPLRTPLIAVLMALMCMGMRGRPAGRAAPAETS